MWAERDGERFVLGELGPGTYSVHVRFTDDAESLTHAGTFAVRSGAEVRVFCDALSWRCLQR